MLSSPRDIQARKGMCLLGTHLVWSIMLRPKEVVEEEISRQGILPIVAPVKPYTLLALTCIQCTHPVQPSTFLAAFHRKPSIINVQG